MRALRAITCAGILLSTVFGQAPAKEEFEVAAVKPFAPLANGGFPIGVKGGPETSDPGRITYTNYTLKYLLMFAYNVKEYQVASPEWMNSIPARFVIEATIRPGATKEQVNEMLRNLLADRFKIALHRETKDFPLHELVVAKNGPKLKEAVEATDVRPAIMEVIMARTGTRRITARGQTAGDLATHLSTPAFGPVLDKTGLTGKYDFTVEYAASDETIAGIRARGIDVQPIPASDLLTAIQEQLGLKLEAKKGPIEMLVVDHAEKTPTEN